MPKERWGNFDLLRLYLALEVVWMHVCASANANPGLIVAPPVATFVCLSGFLIPRSLAVSRNWGHFAWKRFLRVVPAFMLCLILTATVFGPWTLPAMLVYYLTMGLVGTSVNGVLWSLMLEEVLYTWHAGMRRWWNGRTVLWAAAFFTALSLALFFLVKDPSVWKKVGGPAPFFLGNAIYFYRDRIERLKNWQIAAVLGPFALLWWVGGIGGWVPYAPVAAAFVVLAWRLPQVPKHVPDFSYGVYVLHQPIIRLVQGEMGPFQIGPAFALVAIGTAALAIPSWYLVERPALSLKDWVPRRRAAPEPVAA